MALVIVDHSAGTTALHGQAALSAVECLDLSILIAAEHDRPVGELEVEADHVDKFGDEVQTAREPEGALPVRLESGARGAPNRHRAYGKVLGLGLRAPTLRRERLLAQ